MDGTRGVNPALALYPVTVAVLAYGLVMSTQDWFGYSSPSWGVALGSALVSVASAAVALAVASADFRPTVAIIAIAGTVIALYVAVAAGVGILFPSEYRDGIPVRAFVIIVVGLFVSTVIAGVAAAGAVNTCRRCFANIGPYHIVISVIVVNTIIVSSGSAFNGLLPDVGVIGLRISYVDRGVFYGLDEEIALAAGMTAILFTIFPVAFVSVATFASATAARRRYSNEEIDRTVSITAIGVSIIAAVVAALSAAIYVAYVISDAHAHHAGLGRDLDVASAIVAGIVAFLGCAIVAVLAGVIAWWYRALRHR